MQSHGHGAAPADGASRVCTGTGHRSWCVGGGAVHGATLAGEEPQAVGHGHQGQKGGCRAWWRDRKLTRMTGRRGGWTTGGAAFIPARWRFLAVAGSRRWWGKVAVKLERA
jgi:hypothetical protein